MIEFLSGGIIPTRYRKDAESIEFSNKNKARAYKKMGDTDVTIANKMGISYFKVAKLLESESRY
jgi:hypothetical protein